MLVSFKKTDSNLQYIINNKCIIIYNLHFHNANKKD